MSLPLIAALSGLSVLASAIPAASSASSSSSPAPSTSATWPVQTFVSESNISIPHFAINRSAETAPGYLFIAPALAPFSGPIIITDDGELIWSSEIATAIDPTPATLNGEPIIAMWNGTSADDIEAYGSVLVLDSSYKLIHNVRLLDPELAGNEFSYADNHENYPTDHGTVLVTTVNATGPYDLTSLGGPKEGWIWDALIYELNVTNNEVLFRWKASDHLDAIPLNASRALPISGRNGSAKNASDPWDWMHLNSITSYKDGYVFSSRHTQSGYYIDGKTGDVVWAVHVGLSRPSKSNTMNLFSRTVDC